MKHNESVWAVFDNRKDGNILESGENSLPAIFGTKAEAEGIIENVSFLNVHECFLVRKKDFILSIDTDGDGYNMLKFLFPKLEALEDWSPLTIKILLDSIEKENKIKLKDIAQPIRVAITGSTISPSIYDSMALLGKKKTLIRILRCLAFR